MIRCRQGDITVYHRGFARTALVALLTVLLLAMPSLSVAQGGTPSPGDESELAPQLPTVDLPTLNEMNYRFELESVWTGSAGTPAELPVYLFEPIVYTEEDVARIAEELGVEGEITSQGAGSYSVSGNGSIFTTPGLLQYVSAVEPPDEDLPSNAEAVALAHEWLRTTGLLPANIGEGEVLATIETPARKIVGFQPATPSPLLSSTPGITVTIGPDATVIEARINWAEITESDVYLLRPVEDAFAQVASRQSYINATLPADQFPQGSTISGTATYDSVSIAYASSGVPGETQFLQPVYVFEGSVDVAEAEGTFDIVAYVPAIVTGLEPVG